MSAPRAFLSCLVVTAVLAGAQVAGGQTITSPLGTKTILPWDDYATKSLRDAWDMKERTDIGWFTWGIDLPTSNITGKRMATDAFDQTIFTGLPNATADSSIFLLDSHSPGAARLGRVGVNYPIATNQYTRLLVKMRMGNEIKPAAFPQIGTVPVMQVYWSRNTIYHDTVQQPTGGTYLLTDANNNQVGIPFTRLSGEPGGAMEGGHYVIYSIPLGDLAALQALNGSIAKWHNVNAGHDGVDVNWGASSAITADSLRFKPANLTGSHSGQVDIDWVRLVAPRADPLETISWTGGGTFDIVISTAADCGASNGNYAVLAYGRTTGYQFNPQWLPNGQFYVGLRDRLTSNPGDTPNNRVVRTCSTGNYTVIDYPELTLTSPNPDGSADDFATVVLNNAWDFQQPGDIDLALNIASLWNATVPAERLSGVSLGNVPLLFGTNVQAPPGQWGDPYIYTLFSTKRGLNTRIDTSRYRLFSADFGIDRERDLNLGSIIRIGWHIAGETWEWQGQTFDAENMTKDIPVRHMRKGASAVDGTSLNYTLDRIRLDLADRTRLPMEQAAPSHSGWTNTMTQCLGTGCAIHRVEPFSRVGIDDFRVDFHEFQAPTTFYVGPVKLAAHQKSGSSFTVSWTSTMPAVPTSGTYANASNWKVRLYAVRTTPESSPGAGDAAPSIPVTRACAANPGVDTFAITNGGSDPTLASGSFSWNTSGTGGLVPGALYFICAGVILPSETQPSVFTLSEVPIIYAPSASTTLAPRLVVDRLTIWLSARHTGAVQVPNLSSKSPAQTVTVTQIGGTFGVGWALDVCVNYDPQNPPTCSGSLDFVRLSTTSGSGTATFTVQVQDSPILPATTGDSLIGAIIRLRETSPGSTANSPLYIQVNIKIYGPAEGTADPLGQVDSPAQNATGIQGALGLSGWVVDDIGLQSVKIYRNCLAAFEPGACMTNIVPGAPETPVVYIGDAAFVPGARPDVEAAFADYPGANQAGWGLAILTNMLPRTTGPFAPNGGQGPLTLFAVASDVDGHSVLLGRVWNSDHTPTAIAMANDSIAKPFGVIDTPLQGGGASGAGYANFGWALTPDNGTGIHIPNNGSTMVVYLDGAPIGNVVYNQCRGTVDNPPPANTYCNDDVSNIFGNVTPQPPLTTRTSNPSRYRNLDATRGPIGSFVLNTTPFSNGLHNIAWSVTDSAGRIEGIGSRNFVVTNGVQGFAAPAGPGGSRVGRDFGLMEEDLGALARVTAPVGVRTGWRLDAPFRDARPRDGTTVVGVIERDRIELGLPATLSGSTWEGYVVRQGRLMSLPLGSSISQDGRFAWATTPGHFGEYELLFVRENAGGLREVLPVRLSVGTSRLR